MKPRLTTCVMFGAAFVACQVDTSKTDSTHKQGLALDSSLGCFTDSPDRDSPYLAYQNGSNSTESCISACKSAGYAYAGTQYSSQCFCGNSYGGQGTSNNCNMACSGNSIRDVRRRLGQQRVLDVREPPRTTVPVARIATANPVTSGHRQFAAPNCSCGTCTGSGWQSTGDGMYLCADRRARPSAAASSAATTAAGARVALVRPGQTCSGGSCVSSNPSCGNSDWATDGHDPQRTSATDACITGPLALANGQHSVGVRRGIDDVIATSDAAFVNFYGGGPCLGEGSTAPGRRHGVGAHNDAPGGTLSLVRGRLLVEDDGLYWVDPNERRHVLI